MKVNKSLPYGESICSLCELCIHLNANKFECLLCLKIHDMPVDGLPVNKALEKISSIKPTEVTRGKAYDLLVTLLDNLHKKHNFIRHAIKNRNDYVKKHILDLKSENQQATEPVILQINEISSEIIEKIDTFEQDLIEFNKTNSKS